MHSTSGTDKSVPYAGHEQRKNQNLKNAVHYRVSLNGVRFITWVRNALSAATRREIGI